MYCTIKIIFMNVIIRDEECLVSSLIKGRTATVVSRLSHCLL